MLIKPCLQLYGIHMLYKYERFKYTISAHYHFYIDRLLIKSKQEISNRIQVNTCSRIERIQSTYIYEYNSLYSTVNDTNT